MLRAHVAAQNRSAGFLFVTGAATPISSRDLVKVFKALLARAGLPEIRFHDLRHLCATLHLMAGTNPAVVAQILGHSTVVLTLNTYSHILAPVQDEAAERMGKLLGSSQVPPPCRRARKAGKGRSIIWASWLMARLSSRAIARPWAASSPLVGH